VSINGTNFTGATAVTFNGSAAVFSVTSNTAIQATVPAAATTGPISVTTAAGTATSATNFTVVNPPTITSSSPTSGPVGSTVSINGTNFTGATAARFNGTTATFTVTSATAIQTTVPAGATTGPVSVTTAAGTATSATSFTVVTAPADFTVGASPLSQRVTPGASTTYTVTITPINAFTGQVAFTVSGLPAGASGTFAPNPATTSATLSVTTSTSTPIGTFTLTITGASGALTRTTTVELTVTRVIYDNAVSSGFRWQATTVTTPSFVIGSGPNRAAMIMVIMTDTAATGVTASLGGISGTLIPGTDSGTTGTVRTLIFCVANPPPGAQTATASWTNSVNGADIGVITVSGADQATPCTNGTFFAGNSQPVTTSVTIASTTGDLTASVAFTNSAWAAPYTNQALKWGVDAGQGGGDIGPGTGTTTHAWTDEWALNAHAVSGANFKAAP
jgi:hypothetical protein